MTVDADVVGWEDWDWRPLARLAGWMLLAGYWAHLRGLALWPCATAFLWNFSLLSLLSFGVFAHLFALGAMGVIRAALFLDEAAYAVSERLVRPFAAAAPFAVQFWTAFAAEISLLLSAAWVWRTLALGPRLLTALAEVFR